MPSDVRHNSLTINSDNNTTCIVFCSLHFKKMLSAGGITEDAAVFKGEHGVGDLCFSSECCS